MKLDEINELLKQLSIELENKNNKDILLNLLEKSYRMLCWCSIEIKHLKKTFIDKDYE